MSNSKDNKAPSAAVLRHLANSIAADIAHAPLLNPQYENLRLLNLDFVTLEPTMTATSDSINAALRHAPHLHNHHALWHNVCTNVATLSADLHDAIERISGPTQSDQVVVSSQSAHP